MRAVKPLTRVQLRELRKAGYDLIDRSINGTATKINGDELDLILSTAFPGDDLEGMGIVEMIETVSAILSATFSGESEKN